MIQLGDSRRAHRRAASTRKSSVLTRARKKVPPPIHTHTHMHTHTLTNTNTHKHTHTNHHTDTPTNAHSSNEQGIRKNGQPAAEVQLQEMINTVASTCELGEIDNVTTLNAATSMIPPHKDFQDESGSGAGIYTYVLEKSTVTPTRTPTATHTHTHTRGHTHTQVVIRPDDKSLRTIFVVLVKGAVWGMADGSLPIRVEAEHGVMRDLCAEDMAKPIWESDGIFLFLTQHDTAPHDNAPHKQHRGKQPHLEQARANGNHDAVWQSASESGENNARVCTKNAEGKRADGGRLQPRFANRFAHPAGNFCRGKGSWRLREGNRDARDFAFTILECEYDQAHPQEGNVVRERQWDRPQSSGGTCTDFTYSYPELLFCLALSFLDCR